MALYTCGNQQFVELYDLVAFLHGAVHPSQVAGTSSSIVETVLLEYQNRSAGFGYFICRPKPDSTTAHYDNIVDSRRIISLIGHDCFLCEEISQKTSAETNLAYFFLSSR